MKAKRKVRRKKPARNGAFMRELIAANVYSALRDESYTLIAKLVDETLKDPVLRERIQRLTRALLKGIAERV